MGKLLIILFAGGALASSIGSIGSARVDPPLLIDSAAAPTTPLDAAR